MAVAAWAIFPVTAVGTFLMIGAYWLDVQDRPDLGTAHRVAWSAATLLFPIAIPFYAWLGGAGWGRFLRIAAFVPALAVTMLVAILTGAFD